MDKILQTLTTKLVKNGLTVATAESLSGGLVAAALTSLPGSSVYFQGGIVAYSNQLKTELLGVPLEVIAQHGAVSEECVRAMVTGVRQKLGVAAAVATTGIAGPDGATPTKPVGLVWLAAATQRGVWVERHVFPGQRSEVTAATVQAALELLNKNI